MIQSVKTNSAIPNSNYMNIRNILPIKNSKKEVKDGFVYKTGYNFSTKQVSVSSNTTFATDMSSKYIINKDGSGEIFCFGPMQKFPKGTFSELYPQILKSYFKLNTTSAKNLFQKCSEISKNYSMQTNNSDVFVKS